MARRSIPALARRQCNSVGNVRDNAAIAETLAHTTKSADWVPTADEIKDARPEDKHFLIVEAAQDLIYGRLPPKAVAEFVGDLVLAKFMRKALRTDSSTATHRRHAR